MIKKTFRLCLAVVFGFGLFLLTRPVSAASLSTTPAGLIADNMLVGNTYDYTLDFGLSDITQDTQVVITTELGDMETWATFNPGKEFTYKKDLEKQVITISFNVPSTAAVKRYQGFIRINAETMDATATASIIGGSRVDVDFTLTNEVVKNLTVTKASIANFPIGSPLALALNLHNLGNSLDNISKVNLQIIDLNFKDVVTLSSLVVTSVNPISYKEAIYEFDNTLAKGQYLANLFISNDNGTVHEAQKLAFSVDVAEPLVAVTPVLDQNSIIIISLLLFSGAIILILIVYITMKRIKPKDAAVALICTILLTPVMAYLVKGYQDYYKTSEMITSHALLIAKTNVETKTAVSDEGTTKKVLGINVLGEETSDKPLSNKPATKNEQGDYIVFQSPDFTSEQVHFIKEGQTIKAVEDLPDWYKVQISEGVFGYLPKVSVKITN